MKEKIFKTAILLMVWYFTPTLKAQDTCIYLFTIPQKASFAAADNLANTYLIHGFDLEKYDSTSRFVTRYSNNRLGVPAYVDASNPLKVLVWYAQFQTAIFLDRNLTELGRLNVGEAGWPSVNSIAMASDGNIWAYDNASFKLMKLSLSGEKMTESEPMNFGFKDTELDNSFLQKSTIKENGAHVFLGFEGSFIFYFDIFSQYIDILYFNGQLSQFEMTGNLLIIARPWIGRLDIMQTGNFKSISVSKDDRNGDIVGDNFVKGWSPRAHFIYDHTFWLSKRRIYVNTESGVAVYRF